MMVLISISNISAETQQDVNEKWFHKYAKLDKENFNDIVELNDGSLFAVGESQAPSYNGILFKIDADGNQLFYKDFTNTVLLFKIIKDNNDYVIVGYGHDSEVVIIKVDENANQIATNSYGGWSKIAKQLQTNKISKTSDGGYIICGSDTNNGPMNGFVLKVDKNLQQEWLIFPSIANAYNELNSIIETSDGNFVAVGQGDDNNVNYHGAGWLLKIDKNGNVLLNMKIDRSQTQTVYTFADVLETNNSDLIIAGTSFELPTSTNPDPSQGILLKIDKNGNELWFKDYGSDKYERIFSLIRTSDGNYVIGGQTEGNVTNGTKKGYIDACLFKVDSNGNELWAKQFGDTTNTFSYLKNVIQTKNGSYIGVGEFATISRYGFVFKVDVLRNIAFDANGGNGLMNSIKMYYNDKLTLPTALFTKDNHEFKGWALTKSNADKGIVDIVDNALYHHKNSNDVTLYAVWNKLASSNNSNSISSNQNVSNINSNLPKTGSSTLLLSSLLISITLLSTWLCINNNGNKK